MDVFSLLIFLALFCHRASSQTYTAQVIDVQLQQIHDNLVAEEAKVESQILNLIAFVNLTISHLKTQNKTQTTLQQVQIANLCGSLETLTSVLTDLATLDSFWPYNNVTACADVNRKITEIDFDVRQYQQLISVVASNVTRLAQQYNWVAYYYTLAYATLVSAYSKPLETQQRVATVVSATSGQIVEFYSYMGQLARAIANETLLGVYLNIFKRNFCICGMNVNSNVGSNLSTLESNIEVVQTPLVKLEKAVVSAASDALSKAQIANTALTGSQAPLLAIYVDRTKSFLSGVVTANDYTNLIWNSVSVCSDLYIRLGLVWFKYYQYLQTLVACNTNATWTTVNRASLNASVLGVTLNEKQLTAVRNLIGSMMKLEPLMQNYSSQLSYSVVKMLQVWVDMRVFGDTYCGCTEANVTSTKLTTTSTLTITTSSTTSASMTTTTTSTMTTTTSTPTTKTTTPTTTTITTTPTTIKSYKCDDSADLKDSSTNVYMKTACWIASGGDHIGAEAACRSQGMELFAIENAMQYSALNAWCATMFGAYTGAVIWVNGLQSTNNTWSYYNPNQGALFSGAAPAGNYVVNYNCLLVHNFNGPFKTGTNYPCSQKMSIFCEYKK